MCIFQHSNISHSRTFITYKLTYQSTNFMCSLVPSFDFFRVALFALCVCLGVPPLLCLMFPCLQFVFVCQFHPCCVSRPSCFSMFGPGWHQVWFCWQFFTLIQKLSWWLCSELRTFTYSPLIAWHGFLCHTVMIITSIPPLVAKVCCMVQQGGLCIHVGRKHGG